VVAQGTKILPCGSRSKLSRLNASYPPPTTGLGCRSSQWPSASSIGCSCSTRTRLTTFHKHGDTVIPWHPGFPSTSSYPCAYVRQYLLAGCLPCTAYDKQHPSRPTAVNMRLSTVVTGLLFGLEAAALKPVPRTVPEIEKAVCIESPYCVCAQQELRREP
jgi:hypothetical protein